MSTRTKFSVAGTGITAMEPWRCNRGIIGIKEAGF
jgi:hypothetical protein